MKCPCVENVFNREKKWFDEANKTFECDGPFYESQVTPFLNGKKSYPVNIIYTYRNVYGVETTITCKCVDMTFWRTKLPKEIVDDVDFAKECHMSRWSKKTCGCGKRLIDTITEHTDNPYDFYVGLTEEYPKQHIIRRLGSIEREFCNCSGVIHDDDYSDEESSDDESDDDSDYDGE